jgi:hypothetical protein
MGRWSFERGYMIKRCGGDVHVMFEVKALRLEGRDET